jgi:hypothetical protein
MDRDRGTPHITPRPIKLGKGTPGLSKNKLGTDHDFTLYCMMSLTSSEMDADRPRDPRALLEEYSIRKGAT